MKRSRHLLHLLGLAGLALLTALVARQGFAVVGAALATAGWGIGVVALFHLVPMTADALAWRVLLDPAERPSMVRLLRARWIGESINSLLPAAQVGGDLVRARLAILDGVDGPRAGASVVLDLTLSILTQVAFTWIGIALLVRATGGGGAALEIALGSGLFGLLIVGFVIAQRSGLFLTIARWLERMLGSRRGLVGSAAALDAEVVALYRRPGRLVASAAWALVAWFVGAGEIWLALRFLGQPVGPGEALLVESLSQAIRGAAFPVPGALGVQEGGFLVLGGILGLSPEVSLAVSLVRRGREILLGLPGLLAWQLVEGRRLKESIVDG